MHNALDEKEGRGENGSNMKGIALVSTNHVVTKS